MSLTLDLHPRSAFRRRMLGGIFSILAGILISGCAGHPIKSENADMTSNHSAPMKSGHLPVNGISMYYEIHGDGAGVPLVLLHGAARPLERRTANCCRCSLDIER